MAEPKNAKFKVWIHKKTGEAVIKPPFDSASSLVPGRMVLVNKTEKDILVKVPALFGTGGAPDPEKVVTVEKGEAKKLDLPVHKDAPEGVYSFPIFSLQTFTFVKANSDPEIIIEN